MDQFLVRAGTGLEVGIVEGIAYIAFVLGACLVLRIAHFPDIGIEGSYVVGACTAAAISHHGGGVFLAISGASLAGVCAGSWTATQHYALRINSLLAGILTVMICFSAAFAILGFKPLLSTLPGDLAPGRSGGPTNASAAIFGCATLAALWLFFSTRWGLVAQCAGEEPRLLRTLGANHMAWSFGLLIAGNAIVAASAGLYALVLGEATLTMGGRKLFIAISSLALGEAIVIGVVTAGTRLGARLPTRISAGLARFLSLVGAGGAAPMLVAAITGSIVYWILYSVTSHAFGADEFSQLIVGVLTVGMLMVVNLWSGATRHLTRWRFVGF